MHEKWKLGLPLALMAAFAASRWPGLMPPNFSAAYAIAFCAGVYFPGALAWWLPLSALFVTDLAIDSYYHWAWRLNAFHWDQLFNYAAYAGIIALGRGFGRRASWLRLLSGGLMGAILFYLITNTAAWLFNPFHNPEYTKDLAGWWIALTRGTRGYPETWEFFRNSLLSGGLFAGLFAGAMKASEAAEENEESEAEEEESGAKEPAAKPSEAESA